MTLHPDRAVQFAKQRRKIVQQPGAALGELRGAASEENAVGQTQPNSILGPDQFDAAQAGLPEIARDGAFQRVEPMRPLAGEQIGPGPAGRRHVSTIGAGHDFVFGLFHRGCGGRLCLRRQPGSFKHFGPR